MRRARAIILALACALTFPARAASPTIDGAVGATAFENDAGNITSISGALTTTLSPDIIVCVVTISNPAGSANTLTNCTGTGLTFVLRKRYNNDMSTNCAILDVNPCNVNIEVWEAVSSGTLSGVTITANFSAQLCHSTGGNNGCRAAFAAFGVNGVASTAAPHDPNGSLPNTNFSAALSAIVSGTYTTTNAHDLLVYYFGSAATGSGACGAGNPLPIFPPVAFTPVSFQGVGSHCQNVGTLSVSGTVSTTYGADVGFTAAAWEVVGDAFTGDAPPPPAPGNRATVWINE